MPTYEYNDHAAGGTAGMDKQKRLREQVALILGDDSHDPIPGVVAIPAIPGLDDKGNPFDWRDPKVGLGYLARDGYLLVRDVDVPRVTAALGGRSGPVSRDGNLNGVTLFWYDKDHLPQGIEDRSVDGVCRFLDGVLGLGVATPDHLLYLVSTGTTCPATEPEPVYTPTRPYPQPPRSSADGAGVRVWVLDSGLLDQAATNAPWLTGVTGDLEDPYDPTTGEILPYAGHGTFCAGVVRTMAPGATVHVAKTFIRVYQDQNQIGTFQTNAGVFESDLAEMAARAVRAGAQILSLQFGAYSRGDLELLGIAALKPMLDHYPGVALISAAGNDEKCDFFWPAAFCWATGVGALNRNWDDRAWFSNFGHWVDVYAPGEDLVNAYVSSGTFTCNESPNEGQKRTFYGMARWSGTCFSTAMVAGMVAARVSQTGESAAEAARCLVREAPILGGVGRALQP